MEDDTERGYMEELKKDYGIDLTRSGRSQASRSDSQKATDVQEAKNLEKTPSASSWTDEKAKLDANLSSEERKKFLLDRHEKLTIENENLKKELEEIKTRIQSFRTPERSQETASDD